MGEQETGERQLGRSVTVTVHGDNADEIELAAHDHSPLPAQAR